jgi:dihydrolipoamide dehydrogenase
MIGVIGGGPAGRIAAMRLAGAGKEVELLEQRKIGGQCLHYGCMVVCALNDIARLLESSRRLADLGVLDGVPGLSYPRLVREMQVIQGKIENVLDAETRNAGVEIRYGVHGSVRGSQLRVDGSAVDAEAAIVASGSRPAIPDWRGTTLPKVYTPHTLASMDSLPEEIAIIGCGVMGAEFAHIYHAFGSHVRLLCRTEFLRTVDPLLRDVARRELLGVECIENARVGGIEKAGDRLAVVYEHPGRSCSVEVDAVLLATGLVPRSDCAEGLQKGPLGEIQVDDRMRTSASGIYACGDVIGPPYLTPVARMEGMVAADNILGRDRRMDYTYIPQSIGLSTDLAASSEESETAVSVASPSPAGPGSFWAVATGGTGAGRIMVEPEDGRISGIAVAAPGAEIIAQYMSFLMREGVTVGDLDRIVETHPTTDGVIGLARYMAKRLREQR